MIAGGPPVQRPRRFMLGDESLGFPAGQDLLVVTWIGAAAGRQSCGVLLFAQVSQGLVCPAGFHRHRR